MSDAGDSWRAMAGLSAEGQIAVGAYTGVRVIVGRDDERLFAECRKLRDVVDSLGENQVEIRNICSAELLADAVEGLRELGLVSPSLRFVKMRHVVPATLEPLGDHPRVTFKTTGEPNLGRDEANSHRTLIFVSHGCSSPPWSSAWTSCFAGDIASARDSPSTGLTLSADGWYSAHTLNAAESTRAVDVVVRCKDEMPFTRRTLAELVRQVPRLGKIVFIDSGSKDGSRECAEEFGCQIIDILPHEYIPGRVINRGMLATSSPYVAYVNADAIPLSGDAVELMIQVLRSDAQVAAVFGRQVARPDASPLTKSDMSRAFGDTTVRTARGAFFSMAASAISRAVWEKEKFSETLKYSEDVDFTYRVQQAGYGVKYVPAAHFEHSHDYNPQATRKRHHGEGVADTVIYQLNEPQLWSDFARPLLGSLARDAKRGLLSPQNALIRWKQATGYFSGRRESSSGNAR